MFGDDGWLGGEADAGFGPGASGRARLCGVVDRFGFPGPTAHVGESPEVFDSVRTCRLHVSMQRFRPALWLIGGLTLQSSDQENEMWEIGEKTIDELIQMVDESRLALPQFQRPSVWGKANWVPFLHTILLGRPTGTLLLLEAADVESLNPRQLDTAPDFDPAKNEWLLLDGQQRMTTLYRAIRSGFGANGNRQIVINVSDALRRGELLEDDLQLVGRQLPGYAELARQGKVDFPTLFDEAKRSGWIFTFIKAHFEQDAEKFASDIRELTPRLVSVGSYRFPVLQIKKDTPLNVVADIFEGMNRRGQPLNKFDLMVARLYQKVSETRYYDLREAWESALADAPNLRRLGVGTDDGMLPLQLIAKQVSRLPSDLRGRVKGLRTGDALELPPGQVIGSPDSPRPALNLEVAVKALDQAAEFLAKHCGVVAPSLLPQQAMLLPLADQFLRVRDERLSDSDLKHWFFTVSLTIDYYGSVTTYADRDCEHLTAWATDGKKPPNVQAFDSGTVDQLDLKMAFTREGNILGRAVMALLVQGGALDWQKGQLQVKEFDSIDFHHVVPEQKLKDWYTNEGRRPIAALTPLFSTTNRSIGTKSARDVIADLEQEAEQIFASHQIDVEVARRAQKSKADFQGFLADRERHLKRFMKGALGL